MGVGVRVCQHAGLRLQPLAISLKRLGDCAGVAVLLRTTLTVRTRMVGAGDRRMLTIDGLLVGALLNMEEYAEAEALG